MKTKEQELLDSLLPKCPEEKMPEFLNQVLKYADEESKAMAELDPIKNGQVKGNC